MKSIEDSKKRVGRMLYVILAALLCFIGPTYFVALASQIIPQGIAALLGLLSFIAGTVVILRVVRD
ncbi:MAG: hypothetical protein JSV35_01885 [Candidatus Bathyarchaeota archaeon]|nr:MAG: hypothetical protein JSV35_01885 [Candidatus Bathyarchaeota archaeon]